MKPKLSYKLFTAFVSMSFLVIMLTAVSYKFVTERNFWTFVNQRVLSRMDDFSLSLVAEYNAHQSWHPLKGDQERWLALYAEHPPKSDFIRNPPLETPESKETEERLDTNQDPFNQQINTAPSKIRRNLPRRFVKRLALFDVNQNHIVGSNESSIAKNYTLKALISDGQTIGWLGLRKLEYFSDPGITSYIKKQSRIFIYLGCVVLILAALISYFFSRHLLAPVRQLAQATKSLSLFKFDTRIHVHSKDELGQLAQDFNRMADTLKKYEELRQQWVSDISHELRTPLSILKGEIEALQDGIRPLDQDQLKSLHSEVLHISKLVAALHDLSLADSQNLLVKKNPIKPLMILRKMVSQFNERLDRHHIDVEMTLQDEDIVVVEGDSSRMAQLFTNLLENALMYTDPPGLLKIHESHDNGWLTIWFEDSAPGVSNHELELIFERLYRVDSSRNRNMGGSGLGLAICKQIVASHEGTISASRTGIGGLSIKVELPRLDADEN